jgi:hypothetical protein
LSNKLKAKAERHKKSNLLNDKSLIKANFTLNSSCKKEEKEEGNNNKRRKK